MSENKKQQQRTDADPPQIVPGYYKVFQEAVPGNGTWREVGFVEATVPELDGSNKEIWYLYAETKNDRHMYVHVGTRPTDQLRFERENSVPGQPKNIKSWNIVTYCQPAVVVGP